MDCHTESLSLHPSVSSVVWQVHLQYKPSQPRLSNFASKLLSLSRPSDTLVILPVAPNQHLQLCCFQLLLLSFCQCHSHQTTHDSGFHYNFINFHSYCHPSLTNHPWNSSPRFFFTSLSTVRWFLSLPLIFKHILLLPPPLLLHLHCAH